jgi:hypothetical protein
VKSTGSATIDQLQCYYLVPAEHPAPDEVRSRLDGVAHDHLADMCSRWLAQLLDPRDPAIWLIRQLNVDLSVDVGAMDDNKLAGIWGRQIALCIAHAIAASADAGNIHLAEPGGSWSEELQPIPRATYATGQDVDGDIVRHYASQAIYVAHFIADLSEGRAWGKWYYRLFDSVSSLTNSAAIRAVITREPESIEEILLYLATQQRLEPVLHNLNEHDARDIFEQLLPSNSSGDDRQRLIELALSAWSSAALPLSSERIATAQNALRLYTAMRQLAPLTSSGDMRSTIDHLLRFAEVLRNVAQPARLISYLLANDLTSAIQLLRAAGGGSASGVTLSLYTESLSFLQQIAVSDEALLHRVASTVATSKVLTLSQGKIDGTIQSMKALLSRHAETADHEITRTSVRPGERAIDFAGTLPLASLQSTSKDVDPITKIRVDSQELKQAPLRPTAGGMADSIVLNTPAGGIFLLLPSLLDLKLHELLKKAPYPAMEAESMIPALRYLLCLKCFGLLHAQWVEVAHDPVLLLVSGLEEAPSPETLLHLSSSATSAMNDLCQQLLLERLALHHYVEGRYLFAELAQISTGDSILLLRDMRHDNWIFASYVTTDSSALLDALKRGLTSLQKAVDIPAEYLVFGPGFGQLTGLDQFHDWPIQAVWTEPVPLPEALPQRLDSVEGEHSVTFWTNKSQIVPQDAQAIFARYLKRHQPAAGDLGYLTLGAHGQPLISNRDVDLTWSLVARALFRAFARRLIGFDQSSFAYLYHNFLAGTSTVFLQQDLIEVRLACSPLHVILRMAGVNGQTYTLPWLNDIGVTLALPC